MSTSTSGNSSLTKNYELAFVELMARSNFSFLQGASHPEELIQTAKQFGYYGMGLCDLNGFYGSARAYREVTQPDFFLQKSQVQSLSLPFRYHVGIELSLPEGNVCIWPQNKKGYSNLCRLVTKSKRGIEKHFSGLTEEDLFLWNEDWLIALLPPWNEARLQRFRVHFGDRLYLPIFRDLSWESHQYVEQAFYWEKQGYQLFVTQRPLFHSAHRKKLHDILTCLYHKCTLSQAGRKLLLNSERRLHTLPELHWLWRDRTDLIYKTVEISHRLNFSLSEIRYRYPMSLLPEGETPKTYLRKLCEQGVQQRFPQGMKCEWQELLNKELELIHELQFEEYFLTLWEICQFARERNILHQGRGSAANSIVCYLLGLTAVDPSRIQMLFERFISKERREPPDIDIDFEHERREEVIQHIFQKFGSERAAMVANVICYRARMALREVAKVLEIPLDKVNQLVRHMGRDGWKRLLSEPHIFKKIGISPELTNDLIFLVSELRGFPRHLGIHSGGFVITEGVLIDEVPVESATMNGRFVVQWNKDDVETLGLMKVDLLSLGMLTALRKAFDLVRDIKKDSGLSLYQLPADDPKTFAMIQKAETVGVFQIESRAQMSLLPRLKPKNYYDLVIEVAIVRPGPIQGGMIHPYLRRRDGLEQIEYADARLKPILNRTLGVPLFQEQVMQMVTAVADFTPGEADQMRRIMSNAWRKKQQMEQLRNRLIEGMRKNGIADSYIEQIYRTIEGFASYGFPESHAASFALLTYASCYLKCHHPDAFACALLNSQPMGFYNARHLIFDAQKNGVVFAPLCIQSSFWDYQLESPGCVRLGFRELKSLRKNEVEKIVQSRTEHGPFIDLNDFVIRTQCELATLESLASARAFETAFGLNAQESLWLIKKIFREKNTLFTKENLDFPELPVLNPWQKMEKDYHKFGFSLETHPLKEMRQELQKKNREGIGLPYFHSRELPERADREWIRTRGLVGIQQRPPTAKGVFFITLEDEFGFMNLVLMPPVYEKYRSQIHKSSFLDVTGRIQKTGSVIHILVSQLTPV